jgi:hypothetical protein
MHDWKNADPDVYHDFHTSWIVTIRRALNHGILPKGYYALAEKSIGGEMIPDVITMHRGYGTNGVGKSGPGRSRSTVIEATPRVRYTATLPPARPESVQRRIKVHRREDHRVVSLVEIVSPGNKSSKKAVAQFVGNVERAIGDGIHVLVIDPIRPGRRDPNGIHALIWSALGGKPYTAPANAPLTVVAYEATNGPRCYVNPFRVGQAVPDSPLFVEPGEFVQVPLERTYMETWDADVLPEFKAELE